MEENKEKLSENLPNKKKFSEKLSKWWRGRLGDFCVLSLVIGLGTLIAKFIWSINWNIPFGIPTQIKWNPPAYFLFIVIALILAIYLFFAKDKRTSILPGLVDVARSFYLDIILLVGMGLLIWNIVDNSSISGATGAYDIRGDIFTLLGILFTFLGVVGVGIYLWIHNKVKEDITKDWKRERILSLAEADVLVHYVHMELYKSVFHSKTYTEDKKDGFRAKEQIDNALDAIEVAVKDLRELERDQIEDRACVRKRLINKNNLAYCLAVKWDYYRENKEYRTFLEDLKMNKLTPELNGELGKKYFAERTMVESCIADIRKIKNKEEFSDILVQFENTILEAERVFSLK